MKDNKILTGIILDENHTLTFVEVCQEYHLTENELIEMLEHGLFHTDVTSIQELNFNQQTLNRIRAASRLKADLGVNLPGVVLALELLDELEEMRKELSILRHHLG